jgi:hypothetical protein
MEFGPVVTDCLLVRKRSFVAMTLPFFPRGIRPLWRCEEQPTDLRQIDKPQEQLKGNPIYGESDEKYIECRKHTI